ncbi:MAG: hypothetical protein FJ406_05065 [Verrucomicrobia bacterium]|nr:hypothetical protein [Verrucomicrobiota bacterium]
MTRYLAALCLFSTSLTAYGQQAKPTPEVELKSMLGKWHVLLAHEADKNKLEDPKFQGSTITLDEKKLDWLAADGKSLWSAGCEFKHVGKPAWELDLTTKDGDKPVSLPGIAMLFDKDILKISWRRVGIEKGRATNFNGNKEHAFLLLSREPLGKPTDKADFAGEWQMLIGFDDAFDKLGLAKVGAVLLIEGDKFNWKSSKNDKGTKYQGTFTLDQTSVPKKIKLFVTFPPPGSGATPTPKEGHVPGIYQFLDDNTLSICYRESGWKNTDAPDARKYPDGFYSDGGLNLWILRRPK